MLLVLSLVSIGLCVALAVWGVRRAFVEVPAQDRAYMDSPPPLFKATWPLVELFSFRLGSLLSVSYRHNLQLSLRHAGLDYALAPENFFAGKVLCALGAAGVHTLLWWTNGGPSLGGLAAVAALGFVFPDMWLRDERLKRQHKILKALPFYLDVITLCVESGLNLTSAIGQAISKAPANPLKNELQRVMRDIRTGRPRLEAFRSLSERLQMPAISNLVSALVTADRQGAALGPILRAQAEQRRNERFMRAEKLAMEAPVKMLFPLIAFIFPCTFAVIGFPIAVKFLEEGFFR